MDDAAAIHELHRCGTVADVSERLSPERALHGTTFHVVESDGEVIAAFALVELGRMRPGALPRLLMHEMRIRHRFRGTNVVDDILTWLADRKGVGRDRELLALTPLEQSPSAFRRFTAGPSHQVFKWAVAEPHTSLDHP
ncbi:hypothetical protein ABTY61_38950 [Kitasatospora sp. NPDC096128]|uniref:hypothetical protein n=1 Tax=Kitasatospora sp. NPDC096128 TaxID=3155547 RepID=UPI00331A3513